MKYRMMVRNLFTDMYYFFNGEQPIGLQDLLENYGDEPLLLAFIGDLQEALKVPYNDVMQEAYQFYTKFCERGLTEEEWDTAVNEIGEFSQKWPNSWCRGLILALLELLEREEKERKTAQVKNDEDATQGAEELEPAA